MKKAKKPYVIIGAGLAGLACARVLADAGRPFLLIDQNEAPGGRVRTVKQDNYQLDVGFQVLLNSYPESSRFFDIEKLNMRYFNSGCFIYTPEKMQMLANPVLHPSQLLQETLSSFVDIKDKAHVISLILKSHLGGGGQADQSTLDYLKNRGFSEHFIEMFWKPFFAGVFLDDKLSVSSEFFMFLMKCFSSGLVGVPEKGMGELPKQMCRSLDPQSVLLKTRVADLQAESVTLEDGKVIEAQKVAFSGVPPKTELTFFGVHNLYFTTQEKLSWGKWLVVVPPKFGLSINNIALMSEVAPQYTNSSESETLISVSVLKHRLVSIEAVENELRQITQLKLSDIKLVKHFEVAKALPQKFGESQGYLEKDGIFYFGDWATTPSINGALESGRRLAENFLQRN